MPDLEGREARCPECGRRNCDGARGELCGKDAQPIPPLEGREARGDGFPLDTATLHMLIAACQINPDTGRTHLMDFLDMGAREKSRTEITDHFDTGGYPVFEVEYEEGFAPFSEQQVIVTLAEEILRLRGEEVKEADRG